MPTLPPGLLVIWTDVAAPDRADFDEWYNREHLPDRISLPGFRTGRRWQAVRGAPEFLATYETASIEAMREPEYRRRLDHPTPWTQRVMPHFRNTLRGLCEITVRAGAGAGGCVATVRLGPDASQRQPLRAWLAERGLADAAGQAGVVSACLAEALAATGPAAPSAEQKLRATPDRVVEWAILIEGTTADAVEHAAQGLLASAAKALGSAPLRAETGVYRFLCGVLPPVPGE